MIRPSARCLGLSAAAFALSMTAVSAGGAARDSALLVWPVLGALIVLDLLTSFRRGLDVVGNAPHQVFAGEEDRLDLEIDRAPEGLRCRLGWPDGLDGPAEEAFSSRSDGPAVARIPFVARRRGRWQIARIWLVWRSRFGLLEFAPCVPVGIDVAVVPNLRPVTSGVIDVAVRSQLFGTKDNPVKGEGSEFHQLRDFTAGMDIRAIDWKRSARYRSLVAKEMRAERNHHVIIALDNGYLMRQEIDGLPKIDLAVNAGLATAWAAAVGGDLVGLFAYDHRPRLFVPPEPGRRVFANLRRATAELEYSSRETNHTLALSHLMGHLKRRSLIIVFSDFVDTTGAELLLENVKALERRHVVVFVALRDPRLESLARDPVDSLDDAAMAVSASDLWRERRIVLQRLSRLGTVVVDVEPSQVSAQLVSTYIDLKAREVI